MSRPAILRRMRYGVRRGHLFVSKGPRYVWTFIGWQANRLARQVGLRRRTWLTDRASFWSRIDLDLQPLAQVAAAVRTGDEERVSSAALDCFLHRQGVRFFFEWSDRSRLLALIAPEVQTATIAAAEQVARRTFRFRGQPPVRFDGPVDWTHRPQGNTDWMWDLNRHSYFVTLGQALWYTGDARYARAFADLLLDWLRSNPADECQPNWASPFEAACRINTWLWAYHLFVSAGALDADTHLEMLKGLWTHGEYLDACLELHVPNNHLLLEAKALAMLGLAMPEFRAARRWRQRGLQILGREVRRQVCPDGVHAERVPHYHRLIAGELLELLVLLANNGLSLPPVLVEGFRRMVQFERHISRPDGKIPLFGDSAHDDPHVRFTPVAGGAALLGQPDLKTQQAALNEMSIWLLGFERVRQYYRLPAQSPAPSRCFPDGGYAVMRDRWGSDGLYMVFDCGPIGYRLSPGHGHADALSLELYAHGRPQVVDSGVYSFQLGEQWRNAFRGTRAHNTVVVDDQDQSILLDSWRVWRPAQVRLHDWASGQGFDFIDASHDGYRRLPGGIIHRRRVFFAKSEYWLVVDLMEGSGEHHFETLFHLPPDVEVRLDRQTGAALTDDLAIVPLYRPDLEVDLAESWVSTRSGDKKPAAVVVHSLHTAAPTVFGTLLYVGAGTVPLRGASSVPRLMDLRVEPLMSPGETNSLVTALALECDGWRDILILDPRPGLNHKRAGPYETDAALTYVRWRADESAASRIVLRRGTTLAQAGRSLVADAGPENMVEIVRPSDEVERHGTRESYAC